MGKTSIEWADKVWNPITGCTKVSQGCKNCYAERVASRFWGDRPFEDVQCHEERLSQPTTWKLGRKVFVNSMSDLFHEKVSFEFLARVFDVMRQTPHHSYIILTKRPERMLEYTSGFLGYWGAKPLSNVWLGVSVENQETAELRIPLLLKTPSAVRFVSAEPLLDEIDISPYLYRQDVKTFIDAITTGDESRIPGNKLDWVVCGGETGYRARPMKEEWALSLLYQCREAKIPFFFKHWGEYAPRFINRCTKEMIRVGRRYAGRLLDDQEWNEFPIF